MFFVCIDACLIERFVVCGVLRMCSANVFVVIV